MKGLMKKELYLLITQYKYQIIMILCYIVIFTLLNGYSFGMLGVYISALMPFGLCALDEKSRWDTYSLSLPYKRCELVISKYIIGLISTVSASFIYLAMMIYKSGSITKTAFINSAIAVFFGAIMISIIMPFVFKFGSAKGRVIMTFFIASVFGIFGAVFSTGKGYAVILNAIYKYKDILYILTPVFTIAAVIISVLISCRIYNNREFS